MRSHCTMPPALEVLAEYVDLRWIADQHRELPGGFRLAPSLAKEQDDRVLEAAVGLRPFALPCQTGSVLRGFGARPVICLYSRRNDSPQGAIEDAVSLRTPIPS
jgi:hypothetical protein